MSAKLQIYIYVVTPTLQVHVNIAWREITRPFTDDIQVATIGEIEFNIISKLITQLAMPLHKFILSFKLQLKIYNKKINVLCQLQDDNSLTKELIHIT